MNWMSLGCVLLCISIGALTGRGADGSSTNELSLKVGEGAAEPNSPPNWYGEGIRSTDKRTPEEERVGFHLPPGFDIALVASEPAIAKPLNMAFDSSNKLWITQTVEYPHPSKLGDAARDCVKILEDTDGDGGFDRITTFADGLNIPIGILPYADGAIVFTIPNLVHLRDTDGDGICDRRDVILGPFDTTRDTHGMVNALRQGDDGWIYACHGYNNQSTVAGRDGHKISMTSGNTFRFKPDGSRVELVTTGQVNPFGMTVDHWGTRFSADCHSKPLTCLVRGACYPSFGRPHDGLGFFPSMMNHLHESTAICGLALYDADQFSSEYRNQLYSGNVMTSRINRDVVVRTGATYEATQAEDFLTSDDPWFRPVDIQLGPDGALYVADFYNRIIGHYEVPLEHPGRDRDSGRIWRIFAKNKSHLMPSSPKATLPIEQLAIHFGNLGASNATERRLALEALTERWRIASQTHDVLFIEQLTMMAESNLSNKSPFVRINSMWLLHRAKKVSAEIINKLLQDDDSLVRQHALRRLTEVDKNSEAEWLKILLPKVRLLLKNREPMVAATAAQVLGLHGEVEDFALLLNAFNQVPENDPMMKARLRIVLRDLMARDSECLRSLSGKSLSDLDKQIVMDVLLGLSSPEALDAILVQLQHSDRPINDLFPWIEHSASHAQSKTLDELIVFLKSRSADSIDVQSSILTRLRETSAGRKNGELATWAGAVATESVREIQKFVDNLSSPIAFESSLNDHQRGLWEATFQLISQYRLTKQSDAILALVRSHKLDQQRRLEAALLYGDLMGDLPIKSLSQFLLGTTDKIDIRDRFLSVVSENLSDASTPPTQLRDTYQNLLRELCKTIPERDQRKVAQSLAASKELSGWLLNAMEEGWLSPDFVNDKSIAMGLESTTLETDRQRLVELQNASSVKRDELIELRASLLKLSSHHPGNTNIGELVFQKHCAICHQLAGKGSLVGPQLDGIGARGPERLLEDILLPDRNVDKAFRTTSFLLDNGTLQTGLIRSETDAVIELIDSTGQMRQIDPRDIESRKTSNKSLMPDGHQTVLGNDGLLDLLEYLKQTAGVKPKP